jgi:hypothetical protein
MYYKCKGVPKDYTEALKWYRKAADQEQVQAQYDLGFMYDKGHGVPHAKLTRKRNGYQLSLAYFWNGQAADQGDAKAQYSLGRMYRDGECIPQDYVLAHMWFNLAAAQGKPEARRLRDLLAEQMTPSQIAEAQRLAREWKPKGQD